MGGRRTLPPAGAPSRTHAAARPMRLLIAEDDQVLADGLLRSLRSAGYAVDQVSHGLDADAALTAHEFDLLILDLGLPRLHGLEVLRRLRERGSKVPVLILTAADSVEQRVQGLDVGADDYMAKPFSLQELEARVRALTRRGLGTASNVIRHGPLSFDATGRVAYINDQLIELSAREGRAARSAVAAGRPAGQQGPAGGAPLRVGRRGQQQRDRGLRAPAAQEDRAGQPADRDGARPGLLPGTRGRLAQMARWREQRSIFGEILDWMLAPLLLLWPMSIVLTWLVAQGIANQPFDRELAAKVRLLRGEIAAQAQSGRPLAGLVLRLAARRRGTPAQRRRRPTSALPGAQRPGRAGAQRRCGQLDTAG